MFNKKSNFDIITYMKSNLPKDPVAYNDARNISEPNFMKVLERYGYINIIQTGKDDDMKHIDIEAEKDSIKYRFDVKDKKEKNTNSQYYYITVAMYNDIKENINADKYKNHYLALRLYKNNMPSGKYLVIKTTVAYNLMWKSKYGDYYCLDKKKCEDNGAEIF